MLSRKADRWFQASLTIQMVWNTLLLAWFLLMIFIFGAAASDVKDHVDHAQMALAGLCIGLLASVIWPRSLLKQHKAGMLGFGLTRVQASATVPAATDPVPKARKPWSLWLWWLLNIFVPLGFAFTLFQIWCLWASARPKDNKAHDYTSSS